MDTPKRTKTVTLSTGEAVLGRLKTRHVRKAVSAALKIGGDDQSKKVSMDYDINEERFYEVLYSLKVGNKAPFTISEEALDETDPEDYSKLLEGMLEVNPFLLNPPSSETKSEKPSEPSISQKTSDQSPEVKLPKHTGTHTSAKNWGSSQASSTVKTGNV